MVYFHFLLLLPCNSIFADNFLKFIPFSVLFLQIIGVEKNLIQLNIIHIGGTKGKVILVWLFGFCFFFFRPLQMSGHTVLKIVSLGYNFGVIIDYSFDFQYIDNWVGTYQWAIQKFAKYNLLSTTSSPFRENPNTFCLIL